jgi:acetyl esterase/lipase
VFETVDELSATWITPQHLAADEIMYYLHGGGYVIGSINTHQRLIATIARKMKVKGFAINYRLSPEYPFPAAVEDALKGYEFLLKQGYSSKKIFIAGDSAGGGLAIATLLELKKKSIPLPCAVVCISPWVDLEGTGNSHTINAATEKLLDIRSVHRWGKAYAGNESLRHPQISPIYADLTGLPPLLIQVSTSELLLDDAVRLHEKAVSSGVDSTLEKWNGLVHVWQVHTFLPEAKKAISNIAAFANRYLG